MLEEYFLLEIFSSEELRKKDKDLFS